MPNIRDVIPGGVGPTFKKNRIRHNFTSTVCPRSLDSNYIVTYYIKWVNGQQYGQEIQNNFRFNFSSS